MNMIVEDRRPVSVERTRVFASDLVAIAKVQHIVGSVVGASFDLEPRRMALLAKLALDAGDLVGCALPPELVMAVVAVGIKSNEASVDTGSVGRWAFELEKRALEEARQVWHDHMERGPERRTPSVIRAHLEQEGDSLPAFEPASIGEADCGVIIPFPARDALPDAG